MTDKKKNILFVVWAYAIFWAMLMIAGTLLMTGVIANGGTPRMIAVAVCSWAPTMALLLLYKKLNPGSGIRAFYRAAFQPRLKGRLILIVTMVQILIFMISVGMLSVTRSVSFGGMFDLSARTIAAGIFWSLVQGATGEESGWRGFLQPSLQKANSVIRSAVIVGAIWGFWHAPLWVLDGTFAGMELVQYILLFMITVISLSVIMGVCCSKCRNLLLPVWMHFMFNFLATLLSKEGAYGLTALDLYIWYAILYVIAAVGYAVWYLRGKNRMPE